MAAGIWYNYPIEVREHMQGQETGGGAEPVTADVPGRALDPAARAAVTALARSLEVFDPPAARRAALRAALVRRLAASAGASAEDHVDAVSGALLAEISILLTHVRPVGTADVVPDPAGAVLAASVLGRLPGLGGAARAVRHQFERWDGSGGPHGLRGPDIPLPARLLAIASTLVGHPQPGAAPNWTARHRRVEELLGSTLDPDLARAVEAELGIGDPFGREPDLDGVLDGLRKLVVEESGSPVDALGSIGAAIRAADRIQDVLLVIAEQARRALDASVVSIGRIDRDEMSLSVLVNVGDLRPDDERFPVGEQHDLASRPGFDELVTGVGLVRAVDDGRADDPGTASLHDRELRSEAAWPIQLGEEVWGVVWAATHATARALDHDDLETLGAVANHVAVAVGQNQRMAEFEELALRDPLTGLGNRRVLDERLREIFQRPSVDRQDVALIMCDVDGLKTVNDSRGHAAGDHLLVEAASALSQAASTVEGSTVCRIGGDEFCIILDGGGMLSAHPVAELASRLFERSGAHHSLSSGVALADLNIHTAAELLRAADEAQYEEKRRRKGLPALNELPSDHDRRRTRRS